MTPADGVGNNVVAPSLQGSMIGQPASAPRWAGDLFPQTSDEWTSFIRVLLLLALIPALWVGIIPGSYPVFAPIVLLIGGYVILLAIGPRWIAGLGQADLTVGIDILVVTLLVAVSGGIHSPFRYLYYLAILAAAARLNARQAIAASLATASIMVFMWVRAADRAPLGVPGFEIGVFISGGFVLALVLGMLTQNQRWTAVMYQTQAKRTAELETLHKLSQKLRTAGTIEETYSILVAEAMQALTADHGMLVFPDPVRHSLTRVSVAGLPADFQGTTLPFVGSTAAQVMESGTSLRTDDLAGDGYSPELEPQRRSYRTLGPVVYVPVQTDEQVIGTLILARKRSPETQPFSNLDVRLLEGIAEMGGIAINRASLHQNLEEAYIQMVLALASAVDARDSYTADHSERISHWAEAVARAMGCSDQDVQDILRAARLHDIGKIGIPDNILRKPMSLTDAEWAVMRRHPLIGQEILRSVERMRGVAKLVRQHQECWDGTGYPDGLQGEQILLGARILAVADAYSAIVDNRSYKTARSHDEAVAELRRCAGTQFDPRVVEAFCLVASKARRAQ